MYLTIYNNIKPYQLTWEDILSNPYLSVEAPRGYKKITVEITPEYGKELWDKRKFGIRSPMMYDTFPTEEHYRHFKIPKKSNPHKMRQIDAPDNALSQVQNYYKMFIEQDLRVLPHKAAHAYVKERSTITAMKVHQANKSKWFLQIDLKDFFNSINEEWLRKMLNMVYPFPFLDKELVNRIIFFSLLNGTLPQGSHLSPLLTNLVMVPIDHALTEKLHN